MAGYQGGDNRTTMTALRKTGIGLVGEIPWGTHFCHFFETTEDLLSVLLPFFRSGLEAKEFCLWVVAEPLTEKEARNALRRIAPDLDRFLADGSLEIHQARDWYLSAGAIDLKSLIGAWDKKLAQAVHHGFAGMRANASEAWLQEKDWRAFSEYEEKLNEWIADKRMIVFCSYPLATGKAAAILDVARTHNFAMAKRNGTWEVVETPEFLEAKAEIRRLNNDLQQRVLDRTAQLAALNEELRAGREQLKGLSRRLLTAQEEERRGLAVELHDELGQVLTAVKINLASLERQSGPSTAPSHLRDAIASVDRAMERVRDIALDLRPSVLDDLGLAAAVRWYADRFARSTRVEAHLSIDAVPHLPPELEIACFRVTQEALTNVARHAQARNVWVELHLVAEALDLKVRDDGIGFDAVAARERAIGGASMGLLGMQERVSLLGGEYELSTRPGGGTKVRARFRLGESSRGAP
jgi:signal transduction histidine kinase